MSQLRFCHEGGRVTGGKLPIPDDLAEYQRPWVEARVGCNRLKCKECGAWVRHGPPGVVAVDNARPHLAEIYAAEDWLELDCIKEDSTNYRLYICKCMAWAGTMDYMMADPDPGYHDPVLPWVCAGHPVPKLPVELSGEVFSSETDIAALVDRIMDGWNPHPMLNAIGKGPALALIWTYAYLLGLPDADSFSRACAARLSDPDPAVVGRALHLFTRFPRADGVTIILDRAERLLRRVTVAYAVPERGYATEIEVFAARLEGQTDPADEDYRRVMALFQRVLLAPLDNLSADTVGELEVDDRERTSLASLLEDLPGRMLRQLSRTSAFAAENDLEWLAEHAVEIERAGPNRWQTVLGILVSADRTRQEEFGHLIVVAGIALIESGLVDLGELRAWVVKGRPRAWVLPIQSAIDERVGS